MGLTSKEARFKVAPDWIPPRIGLLDFTSIQENCINALEKAFTVSFTLALLFHPHLALGSQKKPCLDLIRPLQDKKDKVEAQGGLWGVFERSDHLKSHSQEAMALDSKISEVLFTLKYLCKTRDGVPLNDLAEYILNNVERKGKEDFRKELGVLGKPKEVIDKWLKFAEGAAQNRTRQLEMDSIKDTIHGAESLINRYGKISDKALQSPDPNPVLPETRTLIEDISIFEKENPCMLKAFQEQSRIPFWDIDENHGGS